MQLQRGEVHFTSPYSWQVENTGLKCGSVKFERLCSSFYICPLNENPQIFLCYVKDIKHFFLPLYRVKAIIFCFSVL